MVGELQLDQISFNPLPSLPRNPHMKVTSRVSPWTLSEGCSTCIFCNQHSVAHTAPHLKRLHSQIRIRKQTRRSTFASLMPVGLASVSNPKFRYLQGSCPLVVRAPCIQQEQGGLDYSEYYHSQMALESEQCYSRLSLQVHLFHPAPC